MFSFPFGPSAVGTPTLTSLLPLKESISSVPCWVCWYLGQGVEGWLLLCCQRLGVEALLWNLLSSGRRVGEESYRLAPLLTNWFHLIRSVREWILSPLGCADPCGEERNRSRVSKNWGGVLASHWPYGCWWRAPGKKQSIPQLCFLWPQSDSLILGVSGHFIPHWSLRTPELRKQGSADQPWLALIPWYWWEYRLGSAQEVRWRHCLFLLGDGSLLRSTNISLQGIRVMPASGSEF